MPGPPILLITAEQYLSPQPGDRVYLVSPSFRFHPARRAFSRLGGPVLVTVIPTRDQQTIRVACCAVRESRVSRPKRQLRLYFLRPPTVVSSAPAPFVASHISLTLVAIAERLSRLRKQPHWELASPVVLAIPPPLAPISVTTVAVRTRAEMSRRAAHYKLGQQHAPDVELIHYRVRNDDGTELTATWRAAVDTQATVIIDTAFRLRVAYAELMGGAFPNNNFWRLEWRQNGGAWNLQGIENAGAPLQWAFSVNFPPPLNFVSATQQISTGIFGGGLAGNVLQAEGHSQAPFNVFEDEPVLKIGRNGGVADGDVFQFRITVNGLPIPSIVIPTVVLSIPPPSQRMQTVTERLAANDTRNGYVRREPFSRLYPPTVVTPGPQPPVAPTPPVVYARIRPRATTKFLRKPTVLQTFAGPSVALAHTRPRKTRFFLSPPTIVRVASVDLLEQTVRVTLAAQPKQARRPHPDLSPPAVVFPTPRQQEQTVRVAVVRTRPRPIASKLSAPTTLQTFSGARVTLARIRPRATVRELSAPTVIGPAFNAPPLRITLVHTRPRHTSGQVFKPTVIAPPIINTFYGPRVVLVRGRRPASTYDLRAPQVIRVPSVEQLEQTVRVSVVRARPRHVSSILFPPTALQVFRGPVVTLARARPRDTMYLLRPAQVVRVPSIEQAEQTIRVAVARTRPRHVISILFPPIAAAAVVFSGPEVTLAHTRPRKTRSFLSPPVVVRVPSVEQAEQTVRVTLARIRPRHTTSYVFAPQVVRVPTVEQALRTIKVTLAKIRPRATTRKLYPPTVVIVNPPVVTTIDVTLALRPGIERQRRDSIYRLNPPTIVLPLPTLRVQTVQVTLARIRPRRTSSVLGEPLAASFIATEIAVALVRHPRQPRRVHWALSPPAVISAPLAAPITVVRVTTRPRRVHWALSPPVVVNAPLAAPVKTVLAGAPATRDPHRRVRSLLSPPVLAQRGTDRIFVRLAAQPRSARRSRSFFLPQAVQALAPPIKVALATIGNRLRRKTGQSALTRIPSLPPAPRAKVTLVRTRPRATRSFLRPPTVIGALPTAGQLTPRFYFHAAVEGRRKRPIPHFDLFPPTSIFIEPIDFKVGTPRGNWLTLGIYGRWKVHRPYGNWARRALSGRWRALRIRGNWKNH